MPKRIVWTDQAKADIRGIEQPIALKILKTLGRYLLTGEGATKQLVGVSPPMVRLRAQDHRVFSRESGNDLKIERVLDRPARVGALDEVARPPSCTRSPSPPRTGPIPGFKADGKESPQ
jgi:hypothetical protein